MQTICMGSFWSVYVRLLKLYGHIVIATEWHMRSDLLAGRSMSNASSSSSGESQNDQRTHVGDAEIRLLLDTWTIVNSSCGGCRWFNNTTISEPLKQKLRCQSSSRSSSSNTRFTTKLQLPPHLQIFWLQHSSRIGACTQESICCCSPSL